MNIRRAFLVLAAALLMPGLAMAGTTAFATFNVEMHFQDNNNWFAADVHMDCDGGLPLDSDSAAPLEDGDDVDFILEFPQAGEGITNCHIYSDDVAGYTTSYSSNGDSPNHATNNGASLPDEVDGCYYSSVSDLDVNECIVTMIPKDSYLRVHKLWEAVGSGDIIDYTARIRVCTDNRIILNSRRSNNRWCVTGLVYGPDDDHFDVTFDGASHAGSRVYIDERTFDSAVEVDITDCVSSPSNLPAGGQGGYSYTVFNGEGTSPLNGRNCTITNTIFFEGIPTLNQYGLAIMVLLMMGVGFVGFRRFV